MKTSSSEIATRLLIISTLAASAIGVSLIFSGCKSSSQKSEAANTLNTPAQQITQGPVTLKIVSPLPNSVVKSNDVALTFDLQNFEIQPDGQHIHVILDNEPYKPCYDLKTPFVLKDLKPGIHTVRAFPALAWHESIKDPGAFATVTFYVQKKSGHSKVNFEKDRVLTYSRPKGKYEGEKTKKIIFDFWLKNVVLSPEGYRVKYQLDDQPEKFVTEWKPQFLENLSAGKHKMTIDLVNKHGHSVRGEFNKTTREFEVAP